MLSCHPYAGVFAIEAIHRVEVRKNDITSNGSRGGWHVNIFSKKF
jgi:hypothetical protein